MKPDAVLTGMSEDAADAEPVSPFTKFDRPVIVFVYGAASADDNFDKIEEVVFKNEKIGLAMKAFRTVKISPDDIQDDALLAEEGKTIPRLILVDPVKEKVKVLEAKKIKVGALYTAMKSVSKNFWKENLDKTVKKHLKMLNERDKVHNEMKNLLDKEGRLAGEDSAKAKRELKELAKEKEELEKLIEELTENERKLWKLTHKHPKEDAVS